MLKWNDKKSCLGPTFIKAGEVIPQDIIEKIGKEQLESYKKSGLIIEEKEKTNEPSYDELAKEYLSLTGLTKLPNPKPKLDELKKLVEDARSKNGGSNS